MNLTPEQFNELHNSYTEWVRAFALVRGLTFGEAFATTECFNNFHHLPTTQEELEEDRQKIQRIREKKAMRRNGMTGKCQTCSVISLEREDPTS